MKQIIYTVIKAGIKEPVKILHFTDAHLTYTTENDSDEHIELEKKRKEVFINEGGFPENTPYEYFRQAIEIGEENGAVLACTGDMMDLQTYGNIKAFREITCGHDMMFTPGGHEHQKRCVRTMEEPDSYWIGARNRLKMALADYDLDFSNRIVNGLNIIMADNSLDYFNKNTLERFKKELAKGLPVIVFSHDPIDDKYLQATEKTHENVQLTEDDYKASHEMIDLIENHPLVKGYVAGHYHKAEQGTLKNGNPFYVTPGLFSGVCRMIQVI